MYPQSTNINAFKKKYLSWLALSDYRKFAFFMEKRLNGVQISKFHNYGRYAQFIFFTLF